MTWEWVALLSVIFACFTVAVCTDSIRKEDDSWEDDLIREVEDIKSEIAQMKSERESVQKLAEEAKKLLSEHNLAKGLRVR